VRCAAKTVLALLLMSGCAPAVIQQGSCERGSASYYSDSLAGHRTASGERYDPQAMTGAHRHWPFGTEARVEWRNRSVDVRINDRGPFTAGAVIDLSHAAAAKLGIVGRGRVNVLVCRQ
jgi:rare lipoprotein A